MHPESRPATHRQRQKEETRRIVRECAAELFEEKGFAKATMRELAARAGVGLGTIFKHFPDKGALLVATFREDIGEVTQRSFETLPKADVTRQLLHLVRGLYTFYARRPALSRVLARESVLMEGAAARDMQELLVDFLERVTKIFAAAAERGELAPDIDCRRATIALWSFYYAALIEGLMKNQFDVESQVELVGQLLEQHLRGIGAGARPSGENQQ